MPQKIKKIIYNDLSNTLVKQQLPSTVNHLTFKIIWKTLNNAADFILKHVPYTVSFIDLPYMAISIDNFNGSLPEFFYDDYHKIRQSSNACSMSHICDNCNSEYFKIISIDDTYYYICSDCWCRYKIE